jgi:L-glyceraldehyde 3-phosphate reductase
MTYTASNTRYDSDHYRRCGRSGVKLPEISLGLWHNFGGVDVRENARAMLRRAFDLGVTHFDLANNYGPPAGSAEETFGQILRQDFIPYRDELIISTKAGYWMWNGPYGEWGSRKYLLASLDQSLKRMGLDYVDIFYSHRFDPETPLEETMGALDTAVRSGRALYAGISNYSPEQTRRAAEILRGLGTPCLIHQPSYSMLNRWIEEKGPSGSSLLEVLEEEGIGCICFSPLAQGLLTDKYLADSLPADSRAASATGFLRPEHVTEDKLAKVRALNQIAQDRGQTMAQLALAWVLRHKAVTSALIGTSKVSQVEDSVGALENLAFSDEELEAIEAALVG